MTELNATAHRILDAAESLTKQKGFNAFSYRDLQKDVGITTASMHYYFPTKQHLALGLIQRYQTQFDAATDEVRRSDLSYRNKLRAIATTFQKGLVDNEFCLCGMLVMDVFAMPSEAQEQLKQFFIGAEGWISQTITDGIEAGFFKANLDATAEAASYLAILEGGCLLARARQDSAYFERMIDAALDQLQAD